MKKNKVFFTPTKPLKNKAVIGKKLGREKNYYCTDHTPAPVARPHLPNARHYFVLIIILLIAILSYVSDMVYVAGWMWGQKASRSRKG